MAHAIKQIFSKTADVFKDSLTRRTFGALGEGLFSLLSGSMFFSLLSREGYEKSASKSLTGRLIGGIFAPFSIFAEGFGREAAGQSTVLNALSSLPAAAKGLSVGTLAAFGGSWAIGLCLTLWSMGGLTKTALFLGVAAVLAAAVLSMIPCTVYGLFANSFLGRLFNIKRLDDASAPQRAGLAPLGTGLMLGCAFALVGIKSAAVALLGVAGVFAMVLSPMLGILACVGLAPFLPTMILAGMLGFTLLCLIFHLAFGGRYSFKLDATGIMIAAFAVMLLFYGFTSYAPRKSMQIALLECLFITSYFLIVTIVDNMARIRRVVFVFCTSALFTGFYGLYQYLSGQSDMTWVDKELFSDLSLRVYSTFENPNVYGEYLLLSIPMALVMVFVSKRLVEKAYYGGISLVLFINLALTYARGCYLAIIFAAAVFVLFAARRLVGAGIAALFALPLVLPASVIRRFTSITNLSDSSTSYRINIWEGTVRMLNDFWALGVGLGQEAYNAMYPRYSLNAVPAPHAHNLFLQVLSEMGIAGFIVLCGFIACFFNRCVTAFKKAKKRTRLFIAAMAAAVAAFLFEGIFEYVWYNYRVFLLFFITLGITGALCAQTEKEGESCFD